MWKRNDLTSERNVLLYKANLFVEGKEKKLRMNFSLVFLLSFPPSLSFVLHLLQSA